MVRSHLFRAPPPGGPFSMALPRGTMGTLPENLAQVKVSEIRSLVFSCEQAPSCLGEKVGLRHSVRSVPDSLSRPLLPLPPASCRGHEDRSVPRATGRGKGLLQLHRCCGLRPHRRPLGTHPRCSEEEKKTKADGYIARWDTQTIR